VVLIVLGWRRRGFVLQARRIALLHREEVKAEVLGHQEPNVADIRRVRRIAR
jgi:hypothetical protein